PRDPECHNSPCRNVTCHPQSVNDYAVRIPLRTAYRTSEALEESASFRMIAARCVSTVLGLMLSTLAICLFVQPSAISCTTLRSRLVSGEGTATLATSPQLDTLSVK